jgi:hypothetical protein
LDLWLWRDQHSWHLVLGLSRIAWGFVGLSVLGLGWVVPIFVGIGHAEFLGRSGVPFWQYLATVASRLVVVGSGCMIHVVGEVVPFGRG